MKLDLLAPLYELGGPFASAYLDTSRDAEDAARAIDLRWQGLQSHLVDLGADEVTLDAMAGEVGVHRDESGRHGQALIAARGSVVLDAVLPQPPPRDTARWSALPDVMPLVAQLGARVPHVVVVVDRAGAEVTVHGETANTSTIEGGTYPIHKVSAGGWSEQRFQRRAENLWDHNAAEVAEAVDGAVRNVGARLVVLAGDVRARAALRDRLSSRSLDVLIEVDEGVRGAGASAEPLAEKVGRLVAEVAARDSEDAVERFLQELGQHDRATQGLEQVLAALQKSAVDTLFIQHDHPSLQGEVWTGPSPSQVARTPEQLWQTGVPDPQQDRADSALVRAAAGTGADLVLVTPGQVDLPDGVGALLRYATGGDVDGTRK
jgi:hypothetical protein